MAIGILGGGSWHRAGGSRINPNCGWNRALGLDQIALILSATPQCVGTKGFLKIFPSPSPSEHISQVY